MSKLDQFSPRSEDGPVENLTILMTSSLFSIFFRMSKIISWLTICGFTSDILNAIWYTVKSVH